MGNTTRPKGPPAPDGGEIADRRKVFERLSRASGRDKDAERAFIQGKMDMVRGDPNLTEEEKEKALEELRRKLEGPAS